jgi:hypothetical protein
MTYENQFWTEIRPKRIGAELTYSETDQCQTGLLVELIIQKRMKWLGIKFMPYKT